MITTLYRLRVTEPGPEGRKTYVTLRDGWVRYCNAAGTPLCLSNLVGDRAAELTFALEDAPDGTAAYHELTRVLRRQWPDKTPHVEVLIAPVSA